MAKQAFLTIFTRCYKRPTMLQRNIEALRAQTCQDFEQIFIVDDVGRGVGWANRQFYEYRAKATGRYVLMLDDDDRLIDDMAIELLRYASIDDPDLVIFKGDHKRSGILPTESVWKREPLCGRISGQDFIVRSDVWREYIHHFSGDQEGDFHFLEALWRSNPTVKWLDEILVEQQWIGNGRPEQIPA